MIIEFEEKLLELIDARIENASDDELFAGGYLRGHISLSAASCEEDGINDVEELKSRIANSLEEARAELTPADRVIVSDLWQELQSQA
ncbi:YfcL family protein [Vibrio parahaemolyticus]|uniref:YfcL family protein n=6 Tax=Vibrio TaxID=662 RepID=A0A072H9S7_VIBPH|nr:MULTISPECIES: YfcL family protein [Vibrio]EFO38539.1 YfcL protein [Vibrio parahaemolyticus Peru-466]EFO52938.1 YfcL protein [Vibrio parahaemolyticus K5030]EJG0762334.1 YfcL family protein [Vibrio parahaemolyticus O5:K30]EJG0872822.1 YfcL family protein [Vibrio parahaemolyticus O3]EJG0901480.1 YfcL family protein [Vibrio parahaemolyticus O3:K56]EJG0922809.1 YfcL family protein [Vibrio parahaemolyticus O1:K68]EJG0933227.1 YfcL family protein [Vibrio parahaemolyticus O1]EJG0947416.1 YfcL fa